MNTAVWIRPLVHPRMWALAVVSLGSTESISNVNLPSMLGKNAYFNFACLLESQMADGTSLQPLMQHPI